MPINRVVVSMAYRQLKFQNGKVKSKDPFVIGYEDYCTFLMDGLSSTPSAFNIGYVHRQSSLLCNSC